MKNIFLLLTLLSIRTFAGCDYIINTVSKTIELYNTEDKKYSRKFIIFKGTILYPDSANINNYDEKYRPHLREYINIGCVFVKKDTVLCGPAIDDYVLIFNTSKNVDSQFVFNSNWLFVAKIADNKKKDRLRDNVLLINSCFESALQFKDGKFVGNFFTSSVSVKDTLTFNELGDYFKKINLNY